MYRVARRPFLAALRQVANGSISRSAPFITVKNISTTTVVPTFPSSCISTTLPKRLFSTVYEHDIEGKEGTLEYRLYMKADGKRISPWHDIPLYTGEKSGDAPVLNYVNEIPRGTSAKMEISTKEENNPVLQDTKKGQLRFYKYSDSLINYGALPQTWEDPNAKDEATGLFGDNDPIDVIEIGKTMPHGAVYKVKPLGCLALLDEGETDWKIIAVNVDDEKAHLVNDIDDVFEHYPGVVEEAREWFRMYKTAEGKGENEYAFSGEAKGRDFAVNIIAENHAAWKRLKSGKAENPGLAL